MSLEQTPGERMGLVDLGSNTARLVIYEYQRERWYQMVDSIREPVRLAEGSADTGELAPASLPDELNERRTGKITGL